NAEGVSSCSTTSDDASMVVDQDLPSFESISKLNVRIREDLDSCLRSLFNRCFKLCLQKINKNPSSDEGYKLLFALPRLVLRKPPRSRVKPSNSGPSVSSNKFTRQLLERFLNSEFLQL